MFLKVKLYHFEIRNLFSKIENFTSKKMDEENPKKSLKIVFLGDTLVGKTCIVNKYITGQMLQNVTATIGAAFVTKEVEVGGETYSLAIWDTAGQEMYRGLAPMYYRNADIAVIVFDITKSATYDSIQYWIGELSANCQQKLTIVICGNKSDLEDERQISFHSANAAASENDALYFETSAVSGSGIERMFEGAVNAAVSMISTTSNSNPDTVATLEPHVEKKKCC